METFNPTLAESDPELLELIRKEKSRQSRELELIASENFANRSVLQTLSSCLHNKYSEGYPGQRHYGGNEFIDQIEILCQKRSLEAYDLNPEEWGVNVQPYSGSLANLCVYTAVVEPHGRIMGLDLTDGGHITHGFFTAKKRISSTSKFFESMPYKIDPATGLINYDQLETLAKLFKPKLIIAGISCYPRHLDYKRFREIADQNDSLLMGDMAHVSSLVATKLAPNPFEHCDIVTTTTHKTLRGPRAGMIFYRKGVRKVTKAGEIIKYDLEERINSAVFPGIQGGPHNNTVAGIATAMKNVKNPQFRKDQEQVLLNAKTLASSLMDKGFTIVTGGTDNHLVCVDLRPLGLTGALAEKILEDISIACNKNSVPGDKSLMNPSGIRLGSPALTTRGLKESDMEKVAEFFNQGIQLVSNVPSLKDYKIKIVEDSAFQEKVKELRNKVESFAVQFPLPGFEDY